jgi:pimeloyl-ACP methyl ester carboxylesterase
MHERYLPLHEEVLYLRHSLLQPGRPTVLFLHGLGDSTLSFEHAFSPETLPGINVLATDFAGYGRSSAAADYSFLAHTRRLRELIEALAEETGLKEQGGLCLVAHSMGAIPAAMLCKDDRQGLVKKLLLAEGALAHYGGFVTSSAYEAQQQNGFDQWFEQEFLREYVLKQFLPRFPHCGSYYASLRFCRKEAFLQNALETRKLHNELDGKWKSRVAKIYAELRLPKLYCYADGSISRETLQFLAENELETKSLHSACHFLMLDKRREFYRCVRDFCCAEA